MARTAEIRFTTDTSEVEAGIERCIALAERFNKVWGDHPRPDGMERVEVKPGDVIVLRYDKSLGANEVMRIKAAAEAWFPNTTVAVLSGGIRVETVLGAN